MTTPLPAAVLWDMDGTLVDTEPYWMRAETELVEAFGGMWTDEDSLALIGSGLWNGARILQSFGVRMDADEIVQRLTERVREQLAEFGVPWQPGAQELLAELHGRGIRSALVTMSIRSMAEDIVRAIPFEAFDSVVTGDSVDNAKPHPEPYLRAMSELGVAPARCVAIEDSPTGIAAATAAGVITIGVPHIVPLDETPADVLWTSLTGRTVSDLAQVLAAGRGAQGGVA